MISSVADARVALTHDAAADSYPQAPFAPPQSYPELRRLAGAGETDPTNRVYPLVRQALLRLGLDAGRAGTADWNPLGEIIRPGDTVLLKPNLVRHFHGFGWDPGPLVTHAAVVRAMLDYVDLALGESGNVVVADAPLQTTDFEAVTRLAGVRALAEWYENTRGRRDLLHDLRLTQATTTASGYITGHARRVRDDTGYAAIDLGRDSCLAQIDGRYAGFRVTNYDPAAMREHHNPDRHEYLVSRRILDANVILNLPKLKTHRKVGVTAALKNLIGINGHKDWLPHHRRGARDDGGDEYQHRSLWKQLTADLLDVEEAQQNATVRQVVRFARRASGGMSLMTRSDPFFEGSWWGNDTLWRTVLDLNRVLLYADRDGRVHPEIQRQVLTVVDGIVAGEGEGPLEPTAKTCGVILAGRNPAAVDAVAARLMGFDYRRIPIIARATEARLFPVATFAWSAVDLRTPEGLLANLRLDQPGPSLGFIPAAGWAGHIELQPGPDEARERDAGR